MKRAVVVKEWAYRVPGGQEVGLQDTRGSRDGSTGSQGVNREV